MKCWWPWAGAIAAPSWRMLAQDAAALVAESLETSQFAVAELSDDRSTLTVRIAKTGETLKDLDAPAHIVTSEPTMSIAGYALSVAQSVSSADLADETRFQDPMLRQRNLAAAAAVPLLRGNRYSSRLLWLMPSRDLSPPTNCSISKPSPIWLAPPLLTTRSTKNCSGSGGFRRRCSIRRYR